MEDFGSGFKPAHMEEEKVSELNGKFKTQLQQQELRPLQPKNLQKENDLINHFI